MTIRAGMQDIVDSLRRDIGDPWIAGTPSTSTFSDDDLQDILDDRAHNESAAILTPDTVLSGSPTVFRAWQRWWESTAVVTDSSGTLLDADSDGTDALRGVWAFVTAPGGDVYLTGRYFDYWGAAANALEVWAARVATEFDFVTDGQQFDRSQKSAGLLKVAREYGRRAFVRT